MELIKHVQDSNLSGSIRIKVKDVYLWFDFYKSKGEWLFEWNKYIFMLKNSKDLKEMDAQDDVDIFDEACNIANELIEKHY